MEYYRPTTIKEALDLYQQLSYAGKNPAYLSGGTEIVTLSRFHLFQAASLIDLTHIPETRVQDTNENYLVLGASLTLNEISEKNRFPLLAVTASRVADHTTRNHITLGGNISGKIIYKEAILPLLVSDSLLLIASFEGLKTVPIHAVFHKELQLSPGEWVVQVLTEKNAVDRPFFSVKKRKIDVIDYPLLTLTAIKVDGKLRVAISGLCDFPFRSVAMEQVLNDPSRPVSARIIEALKVIPGDVRNDWIASAEYRRFVLQTTLEEMYAALGGM